MPDLRLMHASMQFSDSPSEERSDAAALVKWADKNGVAFLTGTEAGQRTVYVEAFTDLAKQYGWKYTAKHGEWVMVNLDKITGKAVPGYAGPFIPGTRGLTAPQGAHGPRGITYLSATVPAIGEVTVGSCHYLTKRSIDATGHSNTPLIKGIAQFGKDHGKGKALVFINGDINRDDQYRDAFDGNPFTTIWDELKKWPATHGRDKAHGSTIDMSASWNADGRVSAKSGRVLDDSDLRLSTDHFPLVATYTIRS
jgi:hypothetical protein